jgi:GT2 family glycosyltransferase
MSNLKHLLANSVSVVIINHNGHRYIEKTLFSTLAENPLEVIVVDDASTDHSVELITKFPVRLVVLSKNSGPTAARNAGARIAKGEHILFLDGDAEITPGYINGLLEVFSRNPKAALVGGSVVESSTGDLMWFRYCVPASLWSEFYMRVIGGALGKIERNLKKWIGVSLINYRWWRSLNRFGHSNYEPEPRKPIQVGWVIEMGFMVRADIFRTVGMFDELYWMFFEGPDLCWRIRKAGYNVWYTPHSRLLHLGGHTGTSQRRQELFRASQKRYIRKLIRSAFFLES